MASLLITFRQRILDFCVICSFKELRNYDMSKTLNEQFSTDCCERLSIRIISMRIAFFCLPLILNATLHAQFTKEIAHGQIKIKGYTGSDESLTIPATIDGVPVTAVGEHAFANCTRLTNLTVSAGVVSIGECAFYGCSGLASVTLPESVTSIGNSAFHDCTELTNLAIPASTASIGELSFSGCKRITNVTIPGSVTSIGELAFNGCKRLTNAIFLGNAPKMGAQVFNNVANNFTVSYYAGATGFTPAAWTDSSGSSWPSSELKNQSVPPKPH